MKYVYTFIHPSFFCKITFQCNRNNNNIKILKIIKNNQNFHTMCCKKISSLKKI